jgi:hypothetical protein
MNERLREELRKYLIVSVYLYVCFGALLLYKAALLSEVGVHSLAFGLAAGKALVLGKFLLIGDAARIGARGRARNLLHRIAQRSVLLLLLLVVLTLVEELIVGKVHGHSLAMTLTELGDKSVPEMLSHYLLMLLILVPLVAVQEISRAMGPGVLRGLFLGAADSSQTSKTPHRAG